MKYNILRIQFLFLLILPMQISNFAQQKSLAEAKLVVDSFSPRTDSIISIGVLINLKDDWHIYWRNPGDSGLPTQIDFILPDGFSISEIKFPAPKVFYSDEIVNYGYSKEVLLIAEMSIPKNFYRDEINLSAKLTSLICKDLCRPFDTTLTLKLNLSESYFAQKNISELFFNTKMMLPVKQHNIKLSAKKKSDSVLLRITKSSLDELNTHNFEFYPYQEGVFKNRVNQKNEITNEYVEIVLQPDDFRIKDPIEVNGIVILNNDPKKTFEINIPITN